ncbi:MAG: hypothetical protein ACYTGR_13160, partial [Planctomycetota bacterium]
MTRLAAACLISILMMPACPADGQVEASGAAQAEAPVRGYVYVEAFEVRSELIVELARFGALDPDAAPLDAGARAALLESLTPRLGGACSLTIDGVPFVPEAKQVEFVRIDEVLGPVSDDRAEIPAGEAMLGAVYAAARDDFPKSIDITWTLYPPSGDVPVDVEVMSGEDVRSDRFVFAPATPSGTWSVPAVAPKPVLLAIAQVESEETRAPFVVAGLLGCLALCLLTVAAFGRFADTRSVWVSAVVVALLAGGVTYDAWSQPSLRVSETQARSVVESLLRNIYFAFAFRDESVIFDTLAESVDGPLLEELYLDIRSGLELEDAGGPRVKVLRVAVIDCAVLQARDDGLRARIVWASEGDVSHWGHSHRRR